MLHFVNKVLKRFGLDGIRKPLYIALSQSFVAVLFIAIDFIFSKQLTISEFGIWKEVFFYMNLGIPLLAFGLPEGYKYFIAKEGNERGYFKNATSFLLVVTIGLLLVLGLLNLLHYFNLLNLGVYYGFSLLFPLPLFAFLWNKTLRFTYINLGKEERLLVFSLVSFALSMFVIAGGYVAVTYYGGNILQWAILLYVSIFLIPAVLYVSGLGFSIFQITWSKTKVREMIYYGFPLYLASFIGVFSNNIDKLIVNINDTEATFAIFAAGAFEIPIFAMVSAAFAQQSFPKIIQFVSAGNETAAKELWMQISKKVSLITYPMILAAMFFAEELIFFVYSDAYQESVILFKTYLLIGLFRNNSYGVLIAAKENTRLVTKITLFLLGVNLVISLLLYYYFGLLGIVLGTLFTNCCMWLVYTVKENFWSLYGRIFLKNKIIMILIVLIIATYLYA